MLLLTKVKQFSNLLKIKKEIGVGYSFSCDFPIRHACDCPESKIMSLKYPHLQLLIRNCQFYMLSVSLGANPPPSKPQPSNFLSPPSTEKMNKSSQADKRAS